MSNSTTQPDQILSLREFRIRLDHLVTSFISKKLALAVQVLRDETQLSTGQIAKKLQLPSDSAVEKLLHDHGPQKGGK